MLKSEMKLAAILLRMASARFSNHGCNDMPRGELAKFTPEEQVELESTYNRYALADNMGNGETELQYSMDWMWMSALASKLEKESQ